MNDKTQALSDADLHAYVDGLLEEQRRLVVEAWLAAHPDDAAKVAAYRRQNAALHALFDPALDEPLPARLQRTEPIRRQGWPLLRYAAVLAWMAIGTMLGWFLHGAQESRPAVAAMALPRQAAVAHAVYTPEVRHPVEVGAEQETHLVAWLSKRLGAQIKAPKLTETGFELVGGRLLPGASGPAAQFMYQDGRGQRLTLYVRNATDGNQESAFRYAREGNVSVFYWVDGRFGYALSGEQEKNELMRQAQVVYHQLNP